MATANRSSRGQICRNPARPTSRTTPSKPRAPSPGSRPFLLLTTAIALDTFTAFAVVVNQVPLLLERGLSTQVAAWALGLGGLGQVLGRLGYTRLVAATSARLAGS